MNIHRKGWFWFLVILVLIAVNQLIFIYFFKISYFDWYLKNGSMIGLVTVLVTFAFEGFDSQGGFISANPRIYFGSYVQLVGAQTFSLGMGTSDNLNESDGAFRFMDFLDGLAQMLLSLLLFVIFILWLTVVVPIQYFPVLILGGLGRVYSRLRIKILQRITVSQAMEIKKISRDEKKPEGWMEIGIGSKPVKFTFILISTALAIVNYYG